MLVAFVRSTCPQLAGCNWTSSSRVWIAKRRGLSPRCSDAQSMGSTSVVVSLETH